MTIAYVAQTRDHLLMLDEDGVCVDVHRRHLDQDRRAAFGAAHCIGAQYVAALDPREPGLLGHDPTLGAPMLFAKVGPTGKISIVRTGPLERFDARSEERPTLERIREERVTEPILRDLRDTFRDLPRAEPEIRYLSPGGSSRPRYEDEEEPTLRFQTPAPTRVSAAPLRPYLAPFLPPFPPPTTPPLPQVHRLRSGGARVA